MQTQLEITRALSTDELRKFGNTEGPCITVCTTLQPAPNQSRMDFQRLKSAFRDAERKLQEGWPDLSHGKVRELIDSLHLVEAESSQWNNGGGSLVVLRSPDVFRAFRLEEEVDEVAVVGDFFHVFPLLRELQTADQTFYILALSQKHVRLLRCTRTSSELVPLPTGTPESLSEWLTTRLPNEAPEHGETPGGGSFTSTTDRDNKGEHISNFYHVINKAVGEALHGQPHPLVLCGVDYERALYAGINTYPHLWPEGVHGSPESLKGGEMHARGLEAVRGFYSQAARKALDLWEKIAGTDRVATSFPEVVKAAFEGRVAHLFAREDARTMGVFDADSMQMRVQGRQEDLVNAAALKTMAFGGDVFVMSPDDVPGGEQISAILRY